MEKMINLRHLLIHEVQDLYSAEEQIIEALPAMIEKANNKTLKNSLRDHLKVTEEQKNRLDEVKRLLGEGEGEEGEGNGRNEKKGFLSGLFSGSGSEKCKGMEGLIKEGEKVMAEDMSPEVLDAAIIASAQKIEHYEICGYGTARAYARELNLGEVAELLEETLDEEYEADDLLTDLAVGKLNEQAERGGEKGNGRSSGNKGGGKKSTSRSNGSGKSNGSARASKTASKSSSAKASTSGGSGGTRGKKSSAGSRSKSSSGKNRASRAKSSR